MRHAWLIIAHNEFGILQRLITMLDAPQSDFYIHYDKKVRVLPDIHAKKGDLHVLSKRIDVRWGSVSQIRTELLLLETALKHGSYDYYHIISGTHLPLDEFDKLYEFYSIHSGKEIMRFWPEDPGDADFKLRRYHLFLRYFKCSSPIVQSTCQKTWSTILKIQRLLGIRHLKSSIFYKTDNWLSLTERACKYLVENKKHILKKYRWSFCGDEYFVASELKEHPSAFNICNYPKLLYVEFQKESPKVFRLKEYPLLQKTGYLWSRKFSEK